MNNNNIDSSFVLSREIIRKENSASSENETIRKININKNHFGNNKNKYIDIYQKIWINLVYFLFGHILITINIFYQNMKNEFLLTAILLYQLPFFFIQIIINIIMFFIYIIKDSFNSFLKQFYDNIKIKNNIKCQFYYITEYTYYVFAFLLLATYCLIIKSKDKIYNIDKNLYCVLGIAVAICFCPLLIFVNLSLLLYIVYRHKGDSVEIFLKIKKKLTFN